MTLSERLLKSAEEIDNRLGPIPGTSSDRIAKELREAAELVKRWSAPELNDFAAGVSLEAVHQLQRWGARHDDTKAPEDWFWTLGYLSGKALQSARDGDHPKALHHCITSAALLANWHAALLAEAAAHGR